MGHVMTSRHVLLVTYHFPPSAASGAFRLLGFARHLPKFDWQTSVVAPPDLPWEPVDQKLLAQVPPETTVWSVPYPRRWPKALRWAAPYALWLARALPACSRAVRTQRPDVVLTSGPPHWVHLLGLYLKRAHGLPWVADFRDPWITTDQPRPRLSCGERWQRRWEQRVMRHADVVVANAPRAAECFQAAYPAHAHKVITVTNGFDPESFPAVPARARADELCIVHAGQLYAGRDPRPFLDALRNLDAGLPPVRAVFLGRTSGNGVDLDAEVRARGLERMVEIREQVSYAECLEQMCRAEVLLLLDSPGRRMGVPAKLYEYLGAGRAILALAENDGDTASILRESGLPYRLAAPMHTEPIRRAVTELAQQQAHGELAHTVFGHPTRFTRESIAGQLAEVLNGCLPHVESAPAAALRPS
jgi:glycosyltransferase involved in cell wall biosynthesis